MKKLSPTFHCRVQKQPKRRGLYLFLETLGGLYGSAEERMIGFEILCNGSFESYSLIPCLIFTMLGSSMRFISFIMYLNHKQMQLHHTQVL
jgi:hypothetical protein